MYKVMLPAKENIDANLHEISKNLGFNSTKEGKAGNFDAKIVVQKFTDGVAVDIYHGLGRIPEGVIQIESDDAVNISTSAKDEKKITLVSASIGGNPTVKLLII